MNSFKDLLPLALLHNVHVQPIIARTVHHNVKIEHTEQELVLENVPSSHSWHITIPENTEINDPVLIGNILSYQENNVIEKLVITIGAHSKVVFNDTLLCAAVHIKEVVMQVQEYAHVTWNGDYKTLVNSFHGVSCTAIVQEQAQFTSNILVDSHGTTECKLVIEMIGQRAQAQVQMACISKEQATVFLESKQNHIAAHTHSAVTVRQLAYDMSQAHYKSVIDITPIAKDTTASQKHHALILSKSAKVFANPQLNVYQNKEVHCMHGSAISHLNELALWYFMTRGIDQKNARDILVEAFFSDMDVIIKKGLGNVHRK